MYTLYVHNSSPPPAGQLDTESVAHGWVLVYEHTHKRTILCLLGKMAGFSTNPWKRFRLFRHPRGNTIIGRLVCEGDITDGRYIVTDAMQREGARL